LVNKNYETYIIVDGNLEDNIIEDIIIKYESLLKKNGVEIKNIEKIGRKRLAYPINKKQNGFYICFEIISNPDYISKLERVYKLDENVLRYLTVYMSKKTIKEKEEYLKKKALMIAKYEAEKKEAEKKEAEKKEAEKKEFESKIPEEKLNRDKESSKSENVEVGKKDIPEKAEEKINQD